MTGVVLRGPPPPDKVDPQFVALEKGEVVHRIYDPTWQKATANGFRYTGPFARFDHHNRPDVQPESRHRGIIYGAKDMGAALILAFSKVKRYAQQWRYSSVVLDKSVRLLDLRGEAAKKAGTTEIIATAPYLSTAQDWSRFFYIHTDFVEPDGLVYALRNECTVYAFFDRTFPEIDAERRSMENHIVETRESKDRPPKKILGYAQTDVSLSDTKIRRDLIEWARTFDLTLDFDATDDPDADHADALDPVAS